MQRFVVRQKRAAARGPAPSRLPAQEATYLTLVVSATAAKQARITLMRIQEAIARTMHKLVKPEDRVWLAAGSGALVDLRTGVPGQDDPARGASWAAARTVPAEVLVELLVGARTPLKGGRLQAVRLRGARITGQLNLEAATL